MKRKFRLGDVPFKLLLEGLLKTIIGVSIIAIYLYVDTRPTAKYLDKCKIELSKKRILTRGCIYEVRGKYRSIYYRFMANGLQYEGWSKDYNLDGIPEEGDSIDIYYSEKDPELNLTVKYYEWQMKRHPLKNQKTSE